MSVGVFEGTAIHEALILNRAGFHAPGVARYRMDRVDIGLLVEGQAQQCAAGGFCVDDRLAGEGGVECVVKQHHQDCIAPDHARGLFVAELHVLLEPERGVECARSRHVGDGQVHEDLLAHDAVSRMRLDVASYVPRDYLWQQ